MKKLPAVRGVVTGLAALLVVVSAIARPMNPKHKFTFSQPVRVPGATLSAGTYYFSSPEANLRTLVRITDENGKLAAQVMGIRDKTRRQGHDLIAFGSNECKPTAIEAWFYGKSSGVRFVYPKEEAASIAASCNEPVPEMHENTLDVSNKVYLVTPQGQEEEYKLEVLSASDEMDRNGFDPDAK